MTSEKHSGSVVATADLDRSAVARHRHLATPGLGFSTAMEIKLADGRAGPRWHERGTPGKPTFTLIELLLAIAIITILAQLLSSR